MDPQANLQHTKPEGLEQQVIELKTQLCELRAKRSEEEARWHRLVAIVEASRDAIWSWDCDGNITSWNPEAERLLQYRADEIVGQSLFVLVPPERLEIVRAALAKLRQGDWYDRYDAVRLKKDGTRVAVELTVSPIRDASGNVTGIATVCRDITQRKRIERALVESEAKYRSLVENANDIVATLDLEFRFTSVNPAAERILGYRMHEIVGSPLSRFVPHDQLALHTDMLRRKLQGEIATRYEMQVLARDGQPGATLEVSSRLIVDDYGKPVGIHAIARDISERKQAEERQRVLVRELQHRTRNILAVIQSIANSTLSRSKDLNQALTTLTGRLHALANAQEFVAAGNTAGLPLRTLVDAALASFTARASINGEPIVIGGNFAQTFALILHELATNASKYGALSTPRGRILVSWRVEGRPPQVYLRFAWIERGGPPPVARNGYGLGMQLVAAVGKPEIAFNPDGFEYVVRIPASEFER
jgi:PAS domain S-box-containing protein